MKKQSSCVMSHTRTVVQIDADLEIDLLDQSQANSPPATRAEPKGRAKMRDLKCEENSSSFSILSGEYRVLSSSEPD